MGRLDLSIGIDWRIDRIQEVNPNGTINAQDNYKGK
jgi:hypothetical protein